MLKSGVHSTRDNVLTKRKEGFEMYGIQFILLCVGQTSENNVLGVSRENGKKFTNIK